MLVCFNLTFGNIILEAENKTKKTSIREKNENFKHLIKLI